MKKLVLACFSAAALQASAADNVDLSKYPQIARDPQVFKKADIDDCRVKKGTALYFGIKSSDKPAGRYGRVIVNKSGALAFEKNPDKEVRFMSHIGVFGGTFAKGNPEKTKELIREKVAMAVAQGYNCASFSMTNLYLTPEFLDAIDFLVYELKRNGIYVMLRLVGWDMGQKGYTFERRDEPKFRCLMCEPEMLGYWERSVVKYLGHKNPYTGIPIAEDPVLIGVNFIGEMNSAYERLMSLIPDLAPLGEQEWRKWLKEKYRDIGALNKAWQTKGAGLKDFEEVSIAHKDVPQRPASDWFEFISFKHEKFNEFCRGVLAKVGYKGLVWEGDGSRRMSEIRPRGTTSELVPIDIYYAHPQGGWGGVGNIVNQDSAVSKRGSDYLLNTFAVKINDRPLVITEQNYCNWNEHVYEGGLLMPAYGAFQGFSQFITYTKSVVKKPTPIDSFSAGSSPVMRANEVLAYLLFKRGDVARAKSRADIVLPARWFEKSLIARGPMNQDQAAVGLMVGLAAKLDGLPRPSGLPKPEVRPADIEFAPTDFSDVFPAGAYPNVDRSCSDNGNFDIAKFARLLRSKKILPERNISDPSKGVYQTDTGQITMRARDKVLKVVTPRTEAVAMPAEAGSETLKRLTVKSTSTGACVALSSLDRAPIDKSSRLLLIYSTQADNAENVYARVAENRLALVKSGKSVCLKVGVLEALAELRDGANFSMYPLRSNGERRGKIPLSREGGAVKISLDTSKLEHGPTVFFEIVAED